MLSNALSNAEIDVYLFVISNSKSINNSFPVSGSVKLIDSSWSTSWFAEKAKEFNIDVIIFQQSRLYASHAVIRELVSPKYKVISIHHDTFY